MAIAIRTTPTEKPYSFQVGDRVRVMRTIGGTASIEYVAIVTKVHPNGDCDLSDPIDFISAVFPKPD